MCLPGCAAIGALLVQVGLDDKEGAAEEWVIYSDMTAVVKALDARGVQEGPLKKRVSALQPSGKVSFLWLTASMHVV